MNKWFGRLLLLIAVVYLLVRAGMEFQQIAWGTGEWLGEFSLKWGIVFFIYILFSTMIGIFVWFALWHREKINFVLEKIIMVREQAGITRWLFAFLVFVSPIWFLQFTSWGLVFHGVYLRIFIWCLVVFWLAVIIQKGKVLLSWTELLTAILLTSSGIIVAAAFLNVTDYPFSLGWSEGNRMWDYSIMFGRHLYDYPADQEIVVWLEAPRQFVGGLPFLLPGLTIEMERFWLACTVVIPYLLLGLAAFRFTRTNLKVWLLTTLWVFIFLKQGPIHPPLVLCAVVTALLWRSPLWIALPLIAATGYFANEGRFTWVFAPGLWIGMLEFAGAAIQNKKIDRNTWIRSILLGLAGMAGGQYGQNTLRLLAGIRTAGVVNTLTSIVSSASAPVAATVTTIVANVSTPTEPLLWYRLLPNETYGAGILVGLLIAILPLIVVLFHLIATKKWTPAIWQLLALIVPLLAFLGVGLVASTKIGGGGDLHNMDMFLIGLCFSVVIAWKNGGAEWFTNINIEDSPVWIKLALVLLFVLPGFQYLPQLRSYHSVEDKSSLVTLTDSPNEKSLELYPSPEVVEDSLETIRKEIALARSQGGEVLFMDQRQLLTFGYIKNVPFIPEYEKKILMNQALKPNVSYFQGFYDDLERHRFALIISDPLRTPIKDSSFQFGEENNVWVKWVANPVLCYYEEKDILKEVGVQLLIPKEDPLDCSAQLP